MTGRRHRLLAVPLLATRMLVVLALAAASLVVVGVVTPAVAQAAPCDAPVANKVACENTRPGTPDWEVTFSDATIEGFTTDISTPLGGRVDFKIDTNALAYRVDVFRLGWYGGVGARQVATLQRTTPQNQPDCLADSATGLVDCGNWTTSVSWTVPTDAVSGLYYARLVRPDTGAENEVPFVVRDDSSRAAVLFQTSDSTWQAYNTYGGNSLYTGTGPGPEGSAYKVSYNRPIRGANIPENFLFNAEYPMLRFLEANGYDLTYSTNVDTARRGELIRNHRVFMAVGHDEYWSAEQRANVEAARDAGVHLAFLTANEVFWKTRWEPAVDASAAPWRTLVTYKETKPGAKIDPSPQWTGTWRDPRLSPPSDGGRPENALIGNMFTVNGYRNDALQVPAEYGRMRLWRNTPLASLPVGTTHTFQPGTLGYEWNTVEDNGFQPPGTAQLSRTTVTMTGPFVLQDLGSTYGPGTKTHALTLYRHPSGSLVFGAGTVQWAWGVDDEHAYRTTTPTSDVRIKQATVNLLADMGVQPATLQAGLTPATPSADTAAPVLTVTSPARITVANPYSFSGTVTDASGQVAGVEVSVDGGASWHPAQWQAGATLWSYPYAPSTPSTVELKVRAVDDSANLSAPVTLTLTIDPRTCPCSLFPDSAVPAQPAAADGVPLELGVKFRSTTDGYVRGIRFYRAAGSTGTQTASLWTASGTRLSTGTATGGTASGWQTLNLPTPVPVTAGTTYVASYFTPSGHYAKDPDFFRDSALTAEPLVGLRSGTDGPNGVFRAGAAGFPTQSFADTNYWVDVIWALDPGPDVSPPLLLGTSPIDNAGSVALSSPVTATFDEAIDPASVRFTVTGSTGTVAGSTTVSADGTTLTFLPAQALAPGVRFTATVDAADAAGNPATRTVRSFVTGSTRPAACPCTIWDDFTVPAVQASLDNGSVEIGTKVRFDGRGEVLGVRFYRGAGATGPNTGSLWSPSGARLATGTFPPGTASGWQTLLFDTPVLVDANTTYVVSYFAPNGRYAVDSGYFDGRGADFGSIHALPSGADGPNGVFRYGSGGVVPTSSFNAGNYWVDVVYRSGTAGDQVPPTLQARSPESGATGIATDAPISATFSEPVDPGSVRVTLTDPGGAGLRVETAVSADGRTVTWTPTGPLSAGTRYVTSVAAADVVGNAMPAAVSWPFTVVTSQVCPCSLFSAATVPTAADTADADGLELGVRFTSTQNGLVTGVRFFKPAGASGSHTGSLWSSAGTRLATGTFTGGTASGWQTLVFTSPVVVRAGDTYTASYTTTGAYALARGYFTRTGVTSSPLAAGSTAPNAPNGVFRVGPGFPSDTFQGNNYWVDPVFERNADQTPPAFVSGSPADGTTDVSLTTSISTTFDEPVDPASAQFALTDPGGARLATVTTVSTDGRTVTWTPTAQLAAATRYAVSVRIQDTAGNLSSAASTWSFTTTATRSCPCTLFSSATVPTLPTSDDPQAIELGVRFSASAAGTVTGVRFYRGPGNAGPHTGSLWTASGQLLATGTFVDETATGWQTLTFGSPVPVTAGATYVASYTAPAGNYSIDRGYFERTGVANPPLSAVATSGSTPNGVYRVGSGFPDSTYEGGNYWVDVVFTDGPTTGGDLAANLPPPNDTTPPTVTARTPAPDGTDQETSTTPSAQFSEPVSVTGAQFLVSPPGGEGVPGTVTPSTDGRTLTFTPAAPLATGTRYTVSVRAADRAGNPMATADVWSFTTGTPPEVASRSPTANSTEVARSAPVSAAFTEPVDPARSTFTVSGPAGAAIPGSVTASADRRVLTFVSATPLADGTTYTARVLAVDLTGTAATTADSWTFSTGAPPTVTERVPAPSATGVALTAPIRAVFSELVDPATVRITVADAGGALLAGATAVAPDRLSATWTPSARLAGSTRYTVGARASDPSGNAMASPDSWSFTASAAQACPCSLFSLASVPSSHTVPSAVNIELGVRFVPVVNGSVTGVRFYKGPGNGGTHTGSLWTAAGARLATGTFTGESAGGWQTLTFATAVPVTAGTVYTASYLNSSGAYSADPGYWARTGVTSPPLTAPASVVGIPNGVFRSGGAGFPTTSNADTNYWVDPVFVDDAPPAVTIRTPSANATGFALDAPVTATFSEPIDPAGASFTLSDPGGARITGAVGVSPDRLSMTLTPSARLAAGTRYTASVRVADVGGNTMAAPDTWAFTAAVTQSCPCTLFSAASVPTEPSVVTGSFVELGVRFTSTAGGTITGVRFFKGAANTGTHTGTLWNTSGTRLATGTLTGESAGGWQTLRFAAPVPVAAGTGYVASYTSPTGTYSRDNAYFQRTAVTSPPLAANQATGSNPNGVFRTGSAGYPNTASTGSSNFWVEPVFVDGPPAVQTRTPGAGATSTSLTAPLTVRFTEPVTAASAQFTLADPAGARLTGAVTLSADQRTLTFTPSAGLGAGTRYTAAVRASDVGGNAMAAPDTWSFTTTTSQTCPCSMFSAATVPTVVASGDVRPVELGVRFTPTEFGVDVRGVRFYKGPTNTGVHTASLWTSNGVRLATGTFTGESASGWQTLLFASRLGLVRGQTYVVSYTTSTGYSVDAGYFTRTGVTGPPIAAAQSGNGVMRVGSGFPNTAAPGGANYWVDVIVDD